MAIFLVMISGRNWLCVHLQVKTWGQIATSQALVTWMISDNLSSTQSIPITDSTVTPCPPQLSEFEPGGWGMVWPFQRGNGIPRNWEAPHFSHQIIHKINFIHFPWPYNITGTPRFKGCPTNHQSFSSLNQFTSLMNFGILGFTNPALSPTVSPSPRLQALWPQCPPPASPGPWLPRPPPPALPATPRSQHRGRRNQGLVTEALRLGFLRMMKWKWKWKGTGSWK